MANRIASHRTPASAVLAAAIALALAGPVTAQDTAATPDGAVPLQAGETSSAAEERKKKEEEEATRLSEVVVTYAASLERALDLKKESVGQVDYILAEDIGKFPDLNLAESLQRVPGVSIARDAGEGRNISVRGLGPQFTRIRMNGMEALSTTGGTDASGGNNRGRGFDFNVFASDLFNKIAVRKTAQADVDEGSLGATVDLYTAHPFDFDGLVAQLSMREGYNDLAESYNPRGAALISNTWADGKVGGLLSIAYSQRDLLEEGHSTVRWDTGTSSGNFNATSPFAAARLASTFTPRIPRYGTLGHQQERLGVTGALQFEPTPDTHITLDGMYADFRANRTEDFLEAISFSRTGTGKPQTIVRDGFIAPDGDLEYGLFDAVDVRSEARFDRLVTRFTQLSLTADHRFSDNFTMDGLIGSSKSAFDNPIQTTITFDRANINGYSWDYREDDRLPEFDYGFDVNSPSNWTYANGLSEIRLRPQSTDNKFSTAQLNGTFKFNDAFALKGGFNWKEYEFITREKRRASEVTIPNLPAGTNLADLSRLITFGNNLDLNGATPETWLAPDIDAFADLFDIYSNSGAFTLSPTSSGALGGNASVKEEDTGGYLQAVFDTQMFGVPLRGDVGVRYVKTDQTSIGFALINNVPTLTRVERDYDDTLPSMNLVWSLNDELLLRFGAAKVMSRPVLGNLTPGVTVSVSGGNRVVTGGDPFLEPFRANTADLALEWYFDEGASLGAALFYKDIETFVQTSRETRPYNTSGLPPELLEGTGASPTDDFQFNIPVNTPGGDLKGVELSYQQQFTFLPSPFDGFGTILNYTYVESEIQYVTAAGAPSLKTDLVGLSKNAYNATLYYEKGRWQARVTVAYRDDYLTTVPGRNNNDVEGTIATTNVDFSATYQLNDNCMLTFEAVNLTDEFNDQFVSSVGDRSSVYTHTGREFLVGFRMKL